MLVVSIILLRWLSWLYLWWSFFSSLLDILMLLRLLKKWNCWLWGILWRLWNCFQLILNENCTLNVINSRRINCIIVIVYYWSTNSWKCASVCSLILEILSAIRSTVAVLLWWSVITFSTSCSWWCWISIIVFTRL